MQRRECLAESWLEMSYFLSPPKLPCLWAPALIQPPQTPWLCLMGLLVFPQLIPRRCVHLFQELKCPASSVPQSESLLRFYFIREAFLELCVKASQPPPHPHPSFPALVFSFFFHHLPLYIWGRGGTLFIVLLEYKFNKSRGSVCCVHSQHFVISHI